MSSQDALERRMAALFIVALALLIWQAPRTPPLRPEPFVSVLKPGEQVFPVAVPPGSPPRLPHDPAKRRAFLADHAVDGFAALPADACEGFVRVSAHHWLRVPVWVHSLRLPVSKPALKITVAEAGPAMLNTQTGTRSKSGADGI